MQAQVQALKAENELLRLEVAEHGGLKLETWATLPDEVR